MRFSCRAALVVKILVVVQISLGGLINIADKINLRSQNSQSSSATSNTVPPAGTKNAFTDLAASSKWKKHAQSVVKRRRTDTQASCKMIT